MSMSRRVLLSVMAIPLVAVPIWSACPAADPADTGQKPKDPAPSVNGTMAGVSKIVLVSSPTGIVTAGDDQTRNTNLVVRGTAPDLHGPVLLAGELEDKDSHKRLPINAFELLVGIDSKGTKEYSIATPASSLPNDTLTPVQISLKKDWIVAGNYNGTLRIGAVGDTAGQDIKLDVSVRPSDAWWLGTALLSLGAGLSWFAVVYAVRQRQMAGNEILVARLGEVLKKLVDQLKNVSAAGAPSPDRTVDHVNQILQQKLRQLLTDKELSAIAGITVPPAGTVTVLDEVEGVTRVVQNGFDALLEMWNHPGCNHNDLAPYFNKMDDLGSAARILADIDQGIKTILSAAGPAATGQKSMGPITQLATLPSETAVAHRVVFTTYVLDGLSFLTVVLLGVYILIWKNPGFGSIGNLIEAFFWGLGLKLGTDAARLGPGDVRTAFGIKIPSV